MREFDWTFEKNGQSWKPITFGGVDRDPLDPNIKPWGIVTAMKQTDGDQFAVSLTYASRDSAKNGAKRLVRKLRADPDNWNLIIDNWGR